MTLQTSEQPFTIDDALLTSRQVRKIAGGISPVSMWRWHNAGTFPPPIVLNKRNYWRRSDVQGWLDERAAQSHAK